MTFAETNRLELELFGPRELEEPGDDLVEPFDFARNDVHVLGEVERLARSAARRRDDDPVP